MLNKVWIPGKVGPGYGSPALIERKENNDNDYQGKNTNAIRPGKVSPGNGPPALIERKEDDDNDYQGKNTNAIRPGKVSPGNGPPALIERKEDDDNDYKSQNTNAIRPEKVSKGETKTLKENNVEVYEEDSRNTYSGSPSPSSKKENKINNNEGYDFTPHRPAVVSPVKETKKPKIRKPKKPTTTTTMNPNAVLPVKAMTYDPEINEAIYEPKIDGRIIDKSFYEATDGNNAYTSDKDSGYQPEIVHYRVKGKSNVGSRISQTKTSSEYNKVEENNGYEESNREYVVEGKETPSKVTPSSGKQINRNYESSQDNVYTDEGEENQYKARDEGSSTGKTYKSNTKIINKTRPSNRIPLPKSEPTDETNYESPSQGKEGYSLTEVKAHKQTVGKQKIPEQPQVKVAPSATNREPESYEDEERYVVQEGSEAPEKAKYKEKEKLEYTGGEEKTESKVYVPVSEEEFKVVDESHPEYKEKYDYHLGEEKRKEGGKGPTVPYGGWDKLKKIGQVVPEVEYGKKEEGVLPITTARVPEIVTPSIVSKESQPTTRPRTRPALESTVITAPTVPEIVTTRPRTRPALESTVITTPIVPEISITRQTVRPIMKGIEDRPTKAPLIIEERFGVEPTTIKSEKEAPSMGKSRQITITNIIRTNETNLPISKVGEGITDESIDHFFHFNEENCYSTPRSLVCCNKNLDRLIEGVMDDIYVSKKVHPCNFRVMVKMLNKKLESDFKLPFEIIMGPSNFGSKSHFRDDLFCKKFINDIYVLVYGTPEEYPIDIS
uniref:Ground-like domain-containing protein n=1 Tax=Strongyloides papillosus TaxID=174720 RepID=A0A0N5BC76_STREA